MPHFSSLHDDIVFTLQHVAQASRVEGWDVDEASNIIAHFGEFAEAVISPTNSIGDQQGARLENGRVILPDAIKDAYLALAGQGWQSLTAPSAYGGMGASPLIAAGISELFSAANHAMQMVCNLVPGAITTLEKFGTEDQKATWIPKLASGAVLSTMCLTEPHAGSDLSGLRTKAVAAGENWHLSGEKIFISGGDQNLSDGILHLVLARTGNVEDGIKGLSLFLCAGQPQITVARLEGKMGIHASPTCHLNFDQADGELIGELGQGLHAMFTIMNHARIDVALQGVAHAARTSLLAADYASERKQGRRPDGSPAMIEDHADVRHMLNEQAALALGARAMCHVTLVELELAKRTELVDFLTPLCKIFASQAGIKAADLGMQVLGGYGYLKEYQMEQHYRDARITAIYEGANGIHAKTMATRGVRPEGGSDAFADLIAEMADGDKNLTAALASWKSLRDDVRKADDPTQLAHDFATQSCYLFYQACWNRINQQTKHHPNPKKITQYAVHVLGDRPKH